MMSSPAGRNDVGSKRHKLISTQNVRIPVKTSSNSDPAQPRVPTEIRPDSQADFRADGDDRLFIGLSSPSSRSQSEFATEPKRKSPIRESGRSKPGFICLAPASQMAAARRYYRLPFARLCVIQSIWQLLAELSPPLLHAETWSASISLSS